MKNALAGLGGVALGAFFVLITGALSIQVIGNEDGAAFDLSNTVVGIVAPRLPLLPSLAITALSCLILGSIALPLRRSNRQIRRFFTIAFSATVLIFIVWAFFLTSERIDGGRPSVGVLKGLEGWVEEGGRSSATHIVATLSLLTLWLKDAVPSTPEPELQTRVTHELDSGA